MEEGYTIFHTAQTLFYSFFSKRDYRVTLPNWAIGEAPSPAPHSQEGCTRISRGDYAEKYILIISVRFIFLIIIYLENK